MSSFHVTAVYAEHPWLAKFFLEHYPSMRHRDAKVRRVDLRLMDDNLHQWPQEEDLCMKRYAGFVFTESGAYLCEVGVKTKTIQGRFAGIVLWEKDARVEFMETVREAVERSLVSHPHSPPYYIVFREAFSGEFTLYKPPHGFTLAEWIKEQTKLAQEELAKSLSAVDNVASTS